MFWSATQIRHHSSPSHLIANSNTGENCNVIEENM
jgi:hypothetical protein